MKSLLKLPLRDIKSLDAEGRRICWSLLLVAPYTKQVFVADDGRSYDSVLAHFFKSCFGGSVLLSPQLK